MIVMVADSITDSDLFHGSPISRNFPKKLKTNLQSVFKSKDSVNEDCFCCSNLMPEEEEEEDVFEDAYDNCGSFGEALNSSDNDKDENPQLEKEDTSQGRRMPTPRKLCQDNKRVKPPETSSKETIERKSKKMKKKRESNPEKQECSICFNVMDATDLAFKPCPCGFQVCLFCHTQISENESRCPGCRRECDKKSDDDDTEERFQLRGRSSISLSLSFKGLDRA